MSSPEATLRALMLRGLADDRAAQRELLAALAVLLRRYHGRRLGAHMADVEDVVQETLIAVHTRRMTYDPSQPFTPWVYALARYKLIDHLRRRRVRLALPLDDVDEAGIEGEHEAQSAQRDVAALLSQLPQAQREAIQLTRIEGWSVEEAAAMSGQSPSSIKVGVHRGLKKLGNLFGKVE